MPSCRVPVFGFRELTSAGRSDSARVYMIYSPRFNLEAAVFSVEINVHVCGSVYASPYTVYGLPCSRYFNI